MLNYLKSQLSLAFILSFLSCLVVAKPFNEALDKATLLSLHDNSQWHTLIHLSNDEFNIKDDRFLLSGKKKSSRNELTQTLKLFYEQPDEALCRYPARFTFLNAHLAFRPEITQETLFDHCEELSKFLDYVPFETLKLNYASEVLSSASSMMGHTFLSAEGKNIKGNAVTHSISFFTEIKTFNPLSLIYDGVIGGMPGFFMVRPYKVDKVQYIEKEQRNLWTYELSLTPDEKQLIQLHIWELRGVDFDYLFQSYNCATLTLYLLALANPNILDEIQLFVSPVDVIKASNKHNLIANESVYLANEWELSMLEEQLPNNVLENIQAFILHNSELNLPNDTNLNLLAVRYLELLLAREDATGDMDRKRLSAAINKQKDLNSELTIDLTDYKNPIKKPQDSILRLSIEEQFDNAVYNLTFLPASHLLSGDNRQYLSESELKIGEISIQLDTQRNDIDINNFTLYGVKSYIPSTPLSPQTSGEFFLGYKGNYLPKLRNNGVFEISGLIGKAYAIHQDVLFFSSLGGGVATNGKYTYPHLEAKFGSTIYMVANTKATYELSVRTGKFFENSLLTTQKLSLTWFKTQSSNFTLTHELKLSDGAYYDSTELSYSRHF